MGFSLKKALRKLDTGARRTLSGLDDARRGDVKGAKDNFKQARGIAADFAKSAFEQAGRDVRNVHRAHVSVARAAQPIAQAAVAQALRDGKNIARSTGHVALDRFMDRFLQTVKTPPPRDEGLDHRFTTLPVKPRDEGVDRRFATLSVEPNSVE